MRPEDPSQPQGQQKPRYQAAVEDVVEDAIKLAGRTMEGASFREKLVALGAFLLFGLGVVGLVVPPYSGL